MRACLLTEDAMISMVLKGLQGRLWQRVLKGQGLWSAASERQVGRCVVAWAVEAFPSGKEKLRRAIV